MVSSAQSQIERAELESVLQSGIFHRAPNLASFLRYICERYFEGKSDQIKEYSIAVEALGRSSGFDQRKDSIVRVEAHRLRKRLAEYYAGPGADHTVKILIANGQYAPQFVHHEAGHGEDLAPVYQAAPVLETDGDSAHEILPTVIPQPVMANPAGNRIIFALVAILIASALSFPVILSAIRHKQKPVARTSPGTAPVEVWQGNSSVPVNSEFRMLAGYSGAPYTDRQGHKWDPDAYFTGGRSIPIAPGKLIEGLPDPDLLHSSREGDFSYAIPLRSGTYELHLYFSETAFSRGNPSEGDFVRSFRVNINGQTRLNLFDALAEADGPNRLQVRVFKDITPSRDGRLHLEFTQQSGQPFLNALEILPSPPGKIRPIRIVARKTPVTDIQGRVWSGDEYVMGGHLTERADTVATPLDKALFEGERFGNFSYHLPVAPGRYRLKLHFAETYFGSRMPGAPPLGKGSRLFDVLANGRILLKNFDIGTEAGGPNRAIERTFDNIEPNAQGLINLEFHPIQNYACVNAIEVEETN